MKEMLSLPTTTTLMQDPTHVLQLADKDMREENDWVTSLTIRDISDVLGKFAYSKKFEAAVELAEELDIDL